MVHQDIVHGDVKCENVLIFEQDAEPGKNSGRRSPDLASKDQMLNQAADFNLYCKLTDFGVSRHPNGGVILGGSRPWQVSTAAANPCSVPQRSLFKSS